MNLLMQAEAIKKNHFFHEFCQPSLHICEKKNALFTDPV